MNSYFSCLLTAYSICKPLNSLPLEKQHKFGNHAHPPPYLRAEVALANKHVAPTPLVGAKDVVVRLQSQTFKNSENVSSLAEFSLETTHMKATHKPLVNPKVSSLSTKLTKVHNLKT